MFDYAATESQPALADGHHGKGQAFDDDGFERNEVLLPPDRDIGFGHLKN
jgi:hypothetical protein